MGNKLRYLFRPKKVVLGYESAHVANFQNIQCAPLLTAKIVWLCRVKVRDRGYYANDKNTTTLFAWITNRSIDAPIVLKIGPHPQVFYDTVYDIKFHIAIGLHFVEMAPKNRKFREYSVL